jgi:adenine-specific DNA methylase
MGRHQKRKVSRRRKTNNKRKSSKGKTHKRKVRGKGWKRNVLLAGAAALALGSYGAYDKISEFDKKKRLADMAEYNIAERQREQVQAMKTTAARNAEIRALAKRILPSRDARGIHIEEVTQ